MARHRGDRPRGRAARALACTRSAARSRSPTPAPSASILSVIGPRAWDVLVAGGRRRRRRPGSPSTHGCAAAEMRSSRPPTSGSTCWSRRRPSRRWPRRWPPRARSRCPRKPPRSSAIERGRPRYGVDMTDENLPGEAGIVDRAVSFTKGCYVGQEPVARMYHKGHPNRHLRGLLLSAPAEPRDAVWRPRARRSGASRRPAVSPALGPIALAILRREVAARRRGRGRRERARPSSSFRSRAS